jgi:hypothetical protein
MPWPLHGGGINRETDSEQHGSWSDCTDAQAGLDPCWSQSHYVGFVMTRLICVKFQPLWYKRYVLTGYKYSIFSVIQKLVFLYYRSLSSMNQLKFLDDFINSIDKILISVEKISVRKFMRVFHNPAQYTNGVSLT